MKKLILISSLHLIGLVGKAQAVPTISDIFSFDVGDEFQSRSLFIPANLARFVVTGKYFSATNDTVFYIRQNDNYYTISFGMPTNATSFVDTIYYTHLTDPITTLIPYTINDSCDSYHDSVYASSNYCGVQIYENMSCLDCCFEETLYNEIYGAGLGWIVDDYQYPAMMVHYRREQFYYRKAISGDSCGIPDRSFYIGLKQSQAEKSICFYPNPASHRLSISNVQSDITIGIYDVLGNLLLETHVDKDGELNVSSLSNGMYTFITEDKQTRNCYKLVIKN
ncbi:MAG: Secretion system C-terminal sorting domain [Bacteroidetes bacterium]|jgi:hypothetical protein|nr:Secretion system C-terminal sorting domain [Bacteroidota bacterium]